MGKFYLFIPCGSLSPSRHENILDLADAAMGYEGCEIWDSNHNPIAKLENDSRWISINATETPENDELVYILNNRFSEKAMAYYAKLQETRSEEQAASSAVHLGARSSAEESCREDIMLDNYAVRMDAGSKPPILTLTGMYFPIDDETTG